MTKKHFYIIAGVIRLVADKATAEQMPAVREIANQMAVALAETNPLFDDERFMAAALGENWRVGV